MKTLLGLVLSVVVNAALLGSLQSTVSTPTPRGEVYISELQAADAAPVYAQLSDGGTHAAVQF